jgi:hypothetical protein
MALVAVGAVAATAKQQQPSRGPISGTPINLTTALTFVDPPGCDFTRQRPCGNAGTFTADDQATADLLCPSGTMAESYFFPSQGPAFTIAERTLTCPDGSTLLLHVKRVEFTPLTDTTALIGETWSVTLGTGRFSLLQGRGTMQEIFDFAAPPDTLGGSLTGTLGTNP